jgi:hypothetical protein
MLTTEGMQGPVPKKLVISRLIKKEPTSSLPFRPLNTSSLMEAQKMTMY